jgi:hypothetical protein
MSEKQTRCRLEINYVIAQDNEQSDRLHDAILTAIRGTGYDFERVESHRVSEASSRKVMDRSVRHETTFDLVDFEGRGIGGPLTKRASPFVPSEEHTDEHNAALLMADREGRRQ